MQPQTNWYRSGKLSPCKLFGDSEANLRAIPSGNTDPEKGALAQIAAGAEPGWNQAGV